MEREGSPSHPLACSPDTLNVSADRAAGRSWEPGMRSQLQAALLAPSAHCCFPLLLPWPVRHVPVYLTALAGQDVPTNLPTDTAWPGKHEAPASCKPRLLFVSQSAPFPRCLCFIWDLSEQRSLNPFTSPFPIPAQLLTTVSRNGPPRTPTS